MPCDLQLSDSGLNLIKEFEGFRLKAYKPTPDDVWTIGWGSTHDVHKGMTITEEEATQRLREDVQSTVDNLNQMIDVPVNQDQFDALVSLAYNIGTGAFRHSTLLFKLNAGLPAYQVASEFAKWNKQNGKVLAGLTNRRQRERDLFLGVR